MEVIVMRGLPGAGKDRWIAGHIRKYLMPGDITTTFPICSADHFHYDVGGGRYDFKPENQGKAHLACLEKCLRILREKEEHGDEYDFHTLFVNNTNTTAAEIAPYWQLALLHKVSVRIVRIHCSFEEACKRNVHAVPPSTIWRMHQNLLTERLPAHWTEEIILGE